MQTSLLNRPDRTPTLPTSDSMAADTIGCPLQTRGLDAFFLFIGLLFLLNPLMISDFRNENSQKEGLIGHKGGHSLWSN